MKEIFFAVTLSPDDVYTAEGFCYSIVAHARTPTELRQQVREAVQDHFEDTEKRPALIHLHFVHHEEMKFVEE